MIAGQAVFTISSNLCDTVSISWVLVGKNLNKPYWSRQTSSESVVIG